MMNVTRYKCSVLAVDDDPAILSLLCHQLGNDFEVLTASSVGQARGLLAQRSVDIVLTDLKLPDEPGLALLDWVRRTTPRTSRILITGTARLEDAADAINQTQVHRLVLKPWRSEDLLQSLRAVSRALLLERSHEQLLDEMRKLNLELEQRVNERTRELEIVPVATPAEKHDAGEDGPLTGLADRPVQPASNRPHCSKRVAASKPDSDSVVRGSDRHRSLQGGQHEPPSPRRRSHTDVAGRRVAKFHSRIGLRWAALAVAREFPATRRIPTPQGPWFSRKGSERM